MSASDDIVCVITTVGTAEDANQMSETLLSQHLVACVQIDGPVTSRYRWAGKTETATEWRLMIKTSQVAWPKLSEKLASIHPYDEPEIILLPISESAPGYRAWVIDQTT